MSPPGDVISRRRALAGNSCLLRRGGEYEAGMASMPKRRVEGRSEGEDPIPESAGRNKKKRRHRKRKQEKHDG